MTSRYFTAFKLPECVKKDSTVSLSLFTKSFKSSHLPVISKAHAASLMLLLHACLNNFHTCIVSGAMIDESFLSDDGAHKNSIFSKAYKKAALASKDRDDERTVNGVLGINPKQKQKQLYRSHKTHFVIFNTFIPTE
jgi:hypothetical protein